MTEGWLTKNDKSLNISPKGKKTLPLVNRMGIIKVKYFKKRNGEVKFTVYS